MSKISDFYKGSGLSWSKITADTTASKGKGYLVSASSNITITLPSSPSEGDVVGVVDADGKATTYTIKIAGNGSPIQSQSTDFVLEKDRAGLTFVYSDATQGWVISTELLGGESGGLSWSKVSSNTTASAGNGYLISASANFTLTLPASPSEGDEVGVVDADGKATTYTLTVARNGSNIMGLSQDLIIDSDRSGFTLVYSDASQGWVVSTEIGGWGGLSWQAITADTSAADGNGYLIIASGNVTVTLPSSPSVGEIVGVVDAAGKATTYTLTIARNGESIQGSASDLVLTNDRSGLTLVYSGSTNGWVVVTEWNGGTGGSGMTWSRITSNTTATSGQGYMISASGDVTLTLPASPSEGDKVGVVDADGKATTYTLTIGRNGSNIMGLGQDLILDSDRSGFTLVYSDSSQGWIISTEIGGCGGLLWKSITADTSASSGNGYLILASSDITVTLPASPGVGDMVGISDAAGKASTYTLTVGRNGEKIQGSSSDLTISTDRAGFTLVYSGSDNGWVIVTEWNGGSGGAGMTWSRITSDTTATAGNGYMISASSNVTVTLPASPSEGDKVGVVDADGKATTYTLTVGRNGSNIMGLAQDMVIDTDRSGFTLVYSNATQGWVVATEINGGWGGLAWEAITSNTTASNGSGYLIIASSDVTVTLPASPKVGDIVGISDAAGQASTYTLTVARNGENIQGSASDLVISEDRSGFSLVYSGSSNGWVIVTEWNGGSGGAGMTWSKITSNTTATAGQGYMISASGNVTLTLPASPSEGDKVGVVDADGKATTYALTVARNGSNIMGLAEDLSINVDRSGFTLVYVDSTQGWVVSSEIGAGGGTVNWSTITADTSASSGNGYLILASGNVTVTLPSSPSAGDIVGIVDAAGKASTYTLTVARNGSNIQGSASDLVLSEDRSGFTLVYSNATNGWVISTEFYGASSGGMSWSRVTSDTTATANQGYMISASSDVTITLPASPSEGDRVGVVDADGKATTHTLKIARNGSNIMGSAQDLTIDINRSGFTLIYSDSTQGWIVSTEIGGNSGALLWNAITSNESATAGNGYMLLASGNLTVTLPASPSVGDAVGIVDAGGNATTYTLTVDRNGENIQGSASNIVISEDRSGFTLVYSGSTNGWVVVTEWNGTSGSGGGGGMTWTRITSDTTATADNGYLISASSNVTLTLPASPSEGDKVGVVDADAKANTYTLTVARNGSNIMGLAQDLVLDINRSGFTLVYSNSSQGWVIATEIGGSGTMTWHTISANTSAAPGNGYLILATANVTVTLPSSPSAGDAIGVVDAGGKASSYTLTVARNGSNIQGSASDLVINTDRSGFTLVYSDATNGWVIVSELTMGSGGSASSAGLYKPWIVDNEVTTDQTPSTSNAGQMFRFTSSTSADRSLTLPSVGSTDDGIIFWVQNESSHLITIKTSDSDQIWRAGAGYGLELAEESLVCLRYDHSRTTWDVINKSGGLVKLEGLKLYLPCDELTSYAIGGSDLVARDLTKRHMVFAVGSGLFLDQPPYNKWGNGCYGLNGSSNYFSANDSSDWDAFASTSGDYTIAGWVRPNNTNNGYLFTHHSSSSDEWAIYIGSSTLYCYMKSSGTTRFSISGSTITTSSWNHFAVVRKGGTIGLYINGVQKAYVGSFTTANFAATLYIGQDGASGSYLNGRLDDLFITASNPYDASPNSSNSDNLSNWNKPLIGVMGWCS